jgi:hypothetical protein
VAYQSLLQGLLGVARISESHQPAIAVEFRALPLKLQRLPADERVQSVTAVIAASIAASHNSKTSSSTSARPSRTAEIFAVPMGVTCRILCYRIAHCERPSSGQYYCKIGNCNILVRAAFHDAGKLPEFARMQDDYKRHCERWGGI